VVDVGIKPGSLALKSNAQPFKQLATPYLTVQKTMAMYYSPSKIIEI